MVEHCLEAVGVVKSRLETVREAPAIVFVWSEGSNTSGVDEASASGLSKPMPASNEAPASDQDCSFDAGFTSVYLVRALIISQS